MFSRPLVGGLPIPPKMWQCVTDVLCDYHTAGVAFVNSKTLANDAELKRMNAIYNQMADCIWFAKWASWQRNEWNKTVQNFQDDIIK